MIRLKRPLTDNQINQLAQALDGSLCLRHGTRIYLGGGFMVIHDDKIDLSLLHDETANIGFVCYAIYKLLGDIAIAPTLQAVKPNPSLLQYLKLDH